MALFWALNEMITLAAKTGHADEAARFTSWTEAIRKSIEEHAWNGEWYIAAYTDAGNIVGGKECREGRIHLNSQTWAIFSGLSKGERLAKAVASIDKYLNTHWGPPVFYPHYSTYDKELGRITTPCTENGTVYVHAATFKIIADCVLGRADQAIDTIKKVMPLTGDPDKNKVEPFVFTNYFCTDAFPEREGRGGHGWFTGTASWMLQLICEWILGARREYDGLLIDPCIPASWKKCKIKRNFRGAVYDIRINRISSDTKGVKSVKVDGRKIEGNLIEAFTAGKQHIVEVDL
jgi:cellobiose phosphorylase